MKKWIKKFWKNRKNLKGKYYLHFWGPFVLVVIIPFFIEGFSVETFSEYKSYYATTLTLYFTMYSFLKNQKEKEDKELNLRKKELEATKDYYRPIFIVESTDNFQKQIKLHMKNEYLYLENIKYYSDMNSTVRNSETQQLKSGEVIKITTDNSFFITAKTLIGETIIFYYFYYNNGYHKIYKYLKVNQDPIIPTFKKQDNYKIDDTSSVWGFFNASEDLLETDYYKESNFFHKTFPIRMDLKGSFFHFYSKSLKASDLNFFFSHVFSEIENHCNALNNYNESLHKVLTNIIDNLLLITNKMTILPLEAICIEKKLNNLLNVTHKDLLNLENFVYVFNIKKFLNILKSYLKPSKDEMINTLEILIFSFKLIKFNNEINSHLPTINEFKSYILVLKIKYKVEE